MKVLLPSMRASEGVIGFTLRSCWTIPWGTCMLASCSRSHFRQCSCHAAASQRDRAAAPGSPVGGHLRHHQALCGRAHRDRWEPRLFTWHISPDVSHFQLFDNCGWKLHEANNGHLKLAGGPLRHHQAIHGPAHRDRCQPDHLALIAFLPFLFPQSSCKC